MTILVTGAAGFIGSNFVTKWIDNIEETVVSLDKLTYAGNINNLISLQNNVKHIFVRGDIQDIELMSNLLTSYKPRAVINFAAESHVDRSIDSPEIFIQTNIVGTFKLINTILNYWYKLSSKDKNDFRFVHISTDEVYGSLELDEPSFTEKKQYQPNSPYSATKASSDHIVRAYYHTYGLPTITTNCSNNYGPRQFPEKLIPLMIYKAINNESLPVYGDGQQIRDWLYVDDHCAAISEIISLGLPGEVYNIGGMNEKTNIEVVNIICEFLDDICPKANNLSYKSQITFVKDRPGHDKRYSIDISKIKNMIGWQPIETFETGIKKTIIWYLNNQKWINNIINGSYQRNNMEVI